MTQERLQVAAECSHKYTSAAAQILQADMCISKMSVLLILFVQISLAVLAACPLVSAAHACMHNHTVPGEHDRPIKFL